MHADELEPPPKRPEDTVASREALLADAAAAIDAALTTQALVYGSPPPDGRDLDLVLAPGGADAAAAALAARGFVSRHGVWARFCGCAVAVVELLPPERLGLTEDDLATMLAEARPLPGLERVVVPAPRHRLLLLARRLVGATRLEPKHRHRIERMLEEDDEAWTRAVAGGDAADVAAIQRLRRLARGERVRRFLPIQLRPPRVLAVCAADGDRALRHARALGDAADALGYASTVVPPGRALAVRAWPALARRLRSGGVVVIVGRRSRPPRLTPPPLVSYVLGDEGGVSAGRRVRRLDPALPVDEVCERIASDAWEMLARGGRLTAALRAVTCRLRRRG